MSSLQLQTNPSFSSGSMPVVSGRENPLWKFSLLEGSSSSSNHIYKLYKIGSWSFHLSLLSEMARNFCDFRILLLAAAAAFIFIQVSPSPLLLLRWILLLIWKLRSKLCFLCLFRIPWKIRFFFFWTLWVGLCEAFSCGKWFSLVLCQHFSRFLLSKVKMFSLIFGESRFGPKR